ncbi:hypothetical protein SmJEL517_g01732 [Synchytrium microbalum]|uniref:Squalene monooxygenase n=1 Tax=Synchytrium microbalum TaxID=1806994 RepID=A0A507CD55_9FUNG|nr:uncharacterized protein SmJEL517_g01732 [Synchytrium microbalum]TPX35854.1 hypothetical protein SmJEL517_g01732 [Synchytrium microbalum]
MPGSAYASQLATIYSNNVPKTDYDVIIVGAGVLGSAMASALGRDGRHVLLIGKSNIANICKQSHHTIPILTIENPTYLERDWKEPDRIVGELLQPGGINALRKLELEHTITGIDGIPVKGYVVIKDNEPQVLTYPMSENPIPAAPKKNGNGLVNGFANGHVGDEKKQTSVGESLGISFHHGRFVMNLRKAARSAPNVTCLEATVASLTKGPVGDIIVGVSATVKKEDGESQERQFNAPLTIVADGCFSKFRKQINPEKDPLLKSNFVGIILHDCPLPYPSYGHVVLAKPSPILLYQIGTHDTRILVDIPGKVPSAGNGELKEYMKTTVSTQLPLAIQPSFLAALESDRLRAMPNSFLPPTTNKQQGVILLGDAMNMRHPLTGGGMTVALWDVVHVRDLLSRDKVPSLSDSKAVVASMKRLHWKRKPLASVVNILAMALYDLFSAGDNPLLKDLQAACFGYFKLGGICVSTPVGLLAGLIPSPITLILHFFAVALYGTFLICKSGPFYKLPFNIIRSVQVLYKAVCVIGPVALTELRN